MIHVLLTTFLLSKLLNYMVIKVNENYKNSEI